MSCGLLGILCIQGRFYVPIGRHQYTAFKKALKMNAYLQAHEFMWEVSKWDWPLLRIVAKVECNKHTYEMQDVTQVTILF